MLLHNFTQEVMKIFVIFQILFHITSVWMVSCVQTWPPQHSSYQGIDLLFIDPNEFDPNNNNNNKWSVLASITTPTESGFPLDECK